MKTNDQSIEGITVRLENIKSNTFLDTFLAYILVLLNLYHMKFNTAPGKINWYLIFRYTSYFQPQKAVTVVVTKGSLFSSY